MIIKTYSHDPHQVGKDKKVVELEIPTDPFEKNAALWAFATYEILDSVQGRLKSYGSLLYRHVRASVNDAVSGTFIKVVLREMIEKGVIKTDFRGEIVWIDPEWKNNIL